MARAGQSDHLATGGRGQKDMVVLPYKDRLLLFSRYLQQLVMESLGKRLNLKGERVDQGIAVYGNKGSTDQHAYIQQLRDGTERRKIDLDLCAAQLFRPPDCGIKKRGCFRVSEELELPV